MTFHAAVWMDQEYAQIFFFGVDGSSEEDFRVAKHHITARLKGRRDSHHRGETHEQKEYFEAIAKTLADAREILVVGPGTAKTQFLKHVHAHEPKLEARIVGIETADHPTPGQILAHARQYFIAKDKMLGTAAI